MRSEFEVCGLSGNGYGFWILQPGHDYLASGPINYEAAFHQTDTTPVTFGIIHGGHKTAKTLYFNKSEGPWQKVYGPWFAYLNSGANREVMHLDAKDQYALETAAWPYDWMNHPLYPLQHQRGSVSGKIAITDGTLPEGALVVLSRATRYEADHWEGQGMDYIYYAKADSLGDFLIEDIRPATYSMYISADGAFDEYRQDGIVVTQNQNSDVGALSWRPKRQGQLLWQIGTPDRRAKEYKYGDVYTDIWGLWYDYPTDFPNGVNFIIGESDEATDWNWAQCNVYTGNPEDGQWGLSPWTVQFELAQVPDTTCHLTIAICGNRAGNLNIKMNNHEITTLNDIYSDGAYIRCGLRGYNQTFTIEVAPEVLTLGTNTLLLTQTEPYRYAGIYYDSIRFEAGFKSDFNNDGVVDLADLSMFAGEWLTCTVPGMAGCVNLD